MSKLKHLTEPNELLPGLKAVFAECGSIKQTMRCARCSERCSLRAVGSAFSTGTALQIALQKINLILSGLLLSWFLQNNRLGVPSHSLTQQKTEANYTRDVKQKFSVLLAVTPVFMVAFPPQQSYPL